MGIWGKILEMEFWFCYLIPRNLCVCLQQLLELVNPAGVIFSCGASILRFLGLFGGILKLKLNLEWHGQSTPGWPGHSGRNFSEYISPGMA